MKSCNELRTLLRSIDHKSYPAYKSLAGAYQFGSYSLSIDHVQGDPFASPSSLHVEIPHKDAGFPAPYYENPYGRVALQDFLTRKLSSLFEDFNFKAKGSGKSGLMSITRCGQEVLERSACQITKTHVVARFHIGFPAFGRTINAGELEKILFDFLPRCVESCFFYRRLDGKKVEAAVFLAEDQQAIRQILKEEKLVAFVANGAILPRKSGVSDLPLKESVPFTSPAAMERAFTLPHKGLIRGMAIPEGITLIVGGGYHGKSTLLEALQMGVYNHISGDGREYVITDDTAIKLRAEDGRSIRNVDISLFINDLPNKKDTRSFSTPDASGSTSQAAGVIEGVEAGSRLFLIDEDTSATNFMVRDDFMQQVISREKEPITPFLERARDLFEEAGISTILVAGSSGAFFYIADKILQMDCYRPVDITQPVKALCQSHPAPRIQAPNFAVPGFIRALPAPKPAGRGGHGSDRRRGGSGSDDRGGRHEHMKVKTFGRDSFSLNKETVDMRYVEQLADSEQTNALAHLLRFGLEQVIDGKKTVRQTVSLLFDTLDKKGWEPFCSSYVPCGLAKPRKQEIFACLNRFRG
ncbi:MAG: ABC-ATPase domain-containing protein [Lachnospiraceae bacterium]|nr:ABC-ATPase domain-containing protein [Lachnospiraceae bacterium]MCI9184975.1 ABC-ATPase domain-containing protein [Lachnospiraceae bacterium]